MDYDTLKAGPELDALVAEKVMGIVWDEKRCRICGWPLSERLEDGCVPESCSFRPGPSLRAERRADVPAAYSTDLVASWAVVEKEHLCIHPASCNNPTFYWVGHISGSGMGMVGDIGNPTIGTGETVMLAICRSALKVVALQESENRS